MALSEKIKDIKFAKSVAGYSVKEVDSFIDSAFADASEYEREISALRVKLEAYDRRTDEIARKEAEALATLESAREEAGRIISEAKEQAVKIVAAGEGAADEKISAAEKNAKALLASANEKGEEIVAAAVKRAEETNDRVADLVAEYEDFEAKFRMEVAKTVKTLSDIKNGAPRVTKTVKEEPEEEESVTEEPASEEAHDFEFVGGKRADIAEKTKEMPKRKLYDTLSVTYDSDDDFSDIKMIKESFGKSGIKNPADF